MIIRQLSESEIPVIARLETLSFSHPWSERSIRDSFESEANKFFTAIEDDRIVGYIGLTIAGGEGYILNVAVHPEHRRKGIGKALVSFLTDTYRSRLSFITLEVRPSNTAARALYEGLGFEKVGERPNYYSNPTENALLLTKRFSKGQDG